MDAEVIKRLLSEWLYQKMDSDLERELCHFLQGRPRFIAAFIESLWIYDDNSVEGDSDAIIRSVLKSYRNCLTTAGVDDQSGSLYFFWKNNFEQVIGNINGGRRKKLVGDILLEACLQSLFSKEGEVEFDPEVADMVSSGLVMIKSVYSHYRCYMAEPMALLAGINYFTNQCNSDEIMDHFQKELFSNFSAFNPTEAHRGCLLELVVVLKFLRGWWKEGVFKEYLPEDCFGIDEPTG
ncbi:hypothetical protein HDU92_000324, partial [Lobulomyces angularis]